MEKTILKLHANGDLETFNTNIIQSGIIGNYSFNENEITVPRIIKHTPNSENMPSWVKNTGNPISFFKEGIVIKGNLIIPPLFHDDFNRANSLTLGSRWEVGEGGFAIVNVADGTAKATQLDLRNNTAVVDVGESDNLSITCKIFPYKSEAIVLRYVNINNYLQVVNELGRIYIRIKKNGTTTTLETNSTYYNSTTLYKITTELRGRQIKVFVNDELLITYTTSTTNDFSGATKFGIKSWTDSYNSNQVGYFDDFTVNKLID